MILQIIISIEPMQPFVSLLPFLWPAIFSVVCCLSLWCDVFLCRVQHNSISIFSLFKNAVKKIFSLEPAPWCDRSACCSMFKKNNIFSITYIRILSIFAFLSSLYSKRLKKDISLNQLHELTILLAVQCLRKKNIFAIAKWCCIGTRWL
jgi:hypothetical protein